MHVNKLNTCRARRFARINVFLSFHLIYVYIYVCADIYIIYAKSNKQQYIKYIYKYHTRSPILLFIIFYIVSLKLLVCLIYMVYIQKYIFSIRIFVKIIGCIWSAYPSLHCLSETFVQDIIYSALS